MKLEEAIKQTKPFKSQYTRAKLDGQLNDSSRRSELTSGQAPYAIILSCADSRVVPELAFDTGLGEIFTVKVAGNVANSSSINDNPNHSTFTTIAVYTTRSLFSSGRNSTL